MLKKMVLLIIAASFCLLLLCRFIRIVTSNLMTKSEEPKGNWLNLLFNGYCWFQSLTLNNLKPTENKHIPTKSASGIFQKHFFVKRILKKFKNLRFALGYDTEGESC